MGGLHQKKTPRTYFFAGSFLASSFLASAAGAAASAVGAASGSSARQTQVTKDRPVDATIMAIVDQIELNGHLKYVKE